ncbi:MAG: hypothetical protein MI757_17440 [Pirellulales bacterium]|nr:hypothetical protein [Pirellulales bacterium]
MKKYHQYPLRSALGQLLADDVQRTGSGEAMDLVAPVPMHWTRRMWRGANSADTLARCIARKLGVLVCCDLVRRTRLTHIQADLQPAQRRTNVRNAFAMSRGSEVRGARVLLVDDVLTTGATCHEVSKTLKNAGAREVAVAVAGRTPASAR